MRTERAEPPLAPLLLGTVVLFVGALVSTVPPPSAKDDYRLTAPEGRSVTVDLIRETSSRLDVRGWWPQSGTATVTACRRADGTTGASYDYDLWAPREQDGEASEPRAAARERDVQVVSDYWKSLGMSTAITATASRFPKVYARGGPIHSAVFDTGAGDHAYQISVQAHCSAGNVAALEEEDDALRAAGIVLPGDEGTLDWNDPRREQMFIPTP